MSLWKRTMDYLGLGPDDAYDDYDAQYDEPERPPARGSRPGFEQDTRGTARAPRGGGYGYEEPVPAAPVRPVPRAVAPRELDPVPARPRMVVPDDSGVVPRPSRQGSAVRSVSPPPGEPYTVRPRRFDQAQEVADKFKDGLPVIMNLEAADREVSRRLIDFASGLCYGLSGTMEKVATGVYLLKPPSHPSYGYDD
jgi:cell division inhibitor SepF